MIWREREGGREGGREGEHVEHTNYTYMHVIKVQHIQGNLSTPDIYSSPSRKYPDFRGYNVHKHGIWGSKSCPVYRGVLTSGSPDYRGSTVIHVRHKQ